MADVVVKTCETCEKTAIKGQRFCGACKSKLLAAMKSSGYLTRRPYMGSYRSPEMREDVYETAYGGNR